MVGRAQSCPGYPARTVVLCSAVWQSTTVHRSRRERRPDTAARRSMLVRVERPSTCRSAPPDPAAGRPLAAGAGRGSRRQSHVVPSATPRAGRRDLHGRRWLARHRRAGRAAARSGRRGRAPRSRRCPATRSATWAAAGSRRTSTPGYSDEGWWHGPDRVQPAAALVHVRPATATIRDRYRRTRHGTPDDHQLPQPGRLPAGTGGRRRRREQLARARAEERERRVPRRRVPAARRRFTCALPARPATNSTTGRGMPVHATGLPVFVRPRLMRCYRGHVRGSLLLTRRGEALS